MHTLLAGVPRLRGRHWTRCSRMLMNQGVSISRPEAPLTKRHMRIGALAEPRESRKQRVCFSRLYHSPSTAAMVRTVSSLCELQSQHRLYDSAYHCSSPVPTQPCRFPDVEGTNTELRTETSFTHADGDLPRSSMVACRGRQKAARIQKGTVHTQASYAAEDPTGYQRIYK